VERGSFVRNIAVDGQVVKMDGATLYAPAQGAIAIMVHVGDAVVKDQLLASIDGAELVAKVSQEQATLTGLRIDWQRSQIEAAEKLSQLRETLAESDVSEKAAEREMQRSREAYKLGAYSELQALRAQDALERAKFADRQARMQYTMHSKLTQFDIDSKKAAVDRQQYLVDDLRRQIAGLQLRSPLSGRVGEIQVVNHAPVTRGNPLITILNTSESEVEIQVPKEAIHTIKSGMSAQLTSDGLDWEATVTSITTVGLNVGMARISFLSSTPHDLQQGQRLQIHIPLDRRDNVLMIDRGEFANEDGVGFLYLVHGNKAERHPVRIGAVGANKVEILDGVTAGEQIVVSGYDAFRGAMYVTLSN
jgi:HlyD family secretion protein